MRYLWLLLLFIPAYVQADSTAWEVNPSGIKAKQSGTFNIGSTNTTSGTLSVATGNSNTASGILSYAGGSSSVASESQSWAYGDTVSALGANSFANGNSSIASAPGSMVHGGFLNVSTNAAYSVMFGSYANATERDANKLLNANTMRLASMSLEVEGSVSFKSMTSITGDYTIPSTIFFVECDATLANISTFLPSYTNVRGKLIEVKKIDASGNGCYIDADGAETIDGASGQAITTQYNVVRMISGSTEWLIR